MARLSLVALTVFLAALGARPSSSEVFTAVVHMEGLLELERELLGDLRSYMAAERAR